MLVEIHVSSSWSPSRDVAAVDAGLVARFGGVIFEPDGRRLRRSIRVPPGTGEDGTVEYLALVEMLGIRSEMLAAWWVGDADDTVDFMGEPNAEVPLDRGSDLDLAVWRVGQARVRELVEHCGPPTLLATGEPGWVMIAPPATDDMFLYPEVPASEGD